MKKSLALAITHIYPNLQPFVDFKVIEENGVQSITVWNAVEAQPTPDQLDAGWFEVLKKQKKEDLSTQCDLSIAGGFSSSALGSAHTYPSHDKAQANFNTEMNRFLTDPSYISCKFYTEDAGWLDHSKDQFFQVFHDGHDFGNAQWEKLLSLMAQVDAIIYSGDPTTQASNQSNLDAINW